MKTLKTNDVLFNKWNMIKKSLDQKVERIYFKERDIWWTSIGQNIGDEQNGKNEFFERPVLIYKKFNNNIFWGICMSSKLKEGEFYFNFQLNNKKRSVILSQFRLLDSKRLIRKIGYINNQDYQVLKDKLHNLNK